LHMNGLSQLARFGNTHGDPNDALRHMPCTMVPWTSQPALTQEGLM
jgi:hypothetical protein